MLTKRKWNVDENKKKKEERRKQVIDFAKNIKLKMKISKFISRKKKRELTNTTTIIKK